MARITEIMRIGLGIAFTLGVTIAVALLVGPAG